MPPPRVVIVADDLTGAMDVAGPLAERGLKTYAVATTAGCTAQQLSGAQVVSINADSRHLSADRASQRVSDIMRDLVHPQADILIKKIDSTLRGNVVAETLAMMKASGRRIAVVAPAFPAQGRTVMDGVVHVNGTALRDTNFARDALSAPPLEPLHHLFRDAAPEMQAELLRAGDPLPAFDRSRLVVIAADSATQDDLRSLIQRVQDRLRDVLLVGSAGVAQAVSDVCFTTAEQQGVLPQTAGRLLFVVGSRAEQSAQQVDALLCLANAKVLAAPNGRVDVRAVTQVQETVVIIRSTPDAEGREGDAAVVARGLADGVAGALESGRFAALIATGGDTATAILERLSQPALEVMGTLLPGIPYSRIGGPQGDVWFVTKAGGFGAPETFASIAQRLRNA
ncbi:MAG: four-carbon acid sugar kinase family protein [Betaproteobacteria bacterium]